MIKISEHNFILDLLFGTNPEDLNYIYRGEFNIDITNYILSLAEKNIVDGKVRPRTKKRVFHIMVESIQNITRHQDFSDENLAQTAFFAIQKSGPIFYITTGNIIDNTEIKALKEKLDNLNNQSKVELTQTYLGVLSNGKISEKGGAGLGLIEIVRKSGNKLLYDFKKVSENRSFVYMHSFINSNTNADEIIKPKKIFTFEYLKNLHTQIVDEHILLLYSNLFEQSSLVGLISVLKSQRYAELSFKKRIVSSMVEMLQNVILHGKMQINDKYFSPGIFFITQKKRNFSLNTINYIDNQEVEDIKKRFTTLNKLSNSELEQHYNKQLFDFSKDVSGGGLGFMELRMKSNNPIGYNVVPFNDKYSMLMLTVTLNEK